MTFENIDTPISDDVLSGDEDGATPETTPVVGEVVEPVVDVAHEAKPEEKPEPKQDREQVIPRARFDELNAKLHQERQEKEELRVQLEAAQKPVAKTVGNVDIAALENEFYEAMMSGEQEKAVAIRSQINEEIFARAEASSTEKVSRKLSEREAKAELEKVAADVMNEFPFLDVNGPQANADAIAEVVEWRDFYVSRGDSLASALSKAVNKVAPSFATVAATPGQQTPAPKVDPRKQAAINRNITDAAAQAPAPVAGIGNRTTPPAPKIETQKDWESLSVAEREAILAGT